jgi:hypothetical protein
MWAAGRTSIECSHGTGDYVIAGNADISQRSGLRAGVLLSNLYDVLPEDTVVRRHTDAGLSELLCLLDDTRG